MRVRLEFVSLNEEFLTAVQSLFGSDATYYRDVRDVPREGAIFLSPTNSFGFMDGGIDMVYTQMFPGVQQEVQDCIRKLGKVTLLGRPYLRVGSALWVYVDDVTALISAPTMFLPHDVSGTRNAYHAMLAALIAADRIREETNWAINSLVVPSLCCGWGHMDPREAARQISEAITEYLSGNYEPEVESRYGYVLRPSRDAEQPPNYDNREIGVGAYADGPVKEIGITCDQS